MEKKGSGASVFWGKKFKGSGWRGGDRRGVRRILGEASGEAQTWKWGKTD